MKGLIPKASDRSDSAREQRMDTLLNHIEPFRDKVSFLGAIVTVPSLMVELEEANFISEDEIVWIKRNFPSTEDGQQMGLDAAYSVDDRIAGLDDETVELFFDLNAKLLGY